MLHVVSGGGLPAIPVLEVGEDFPMETLIADEARAHALIDNATRYVPRTALKTADAVSRRWLAKWSNAHLDEIDRIARRLNRPGAYYLSVNYEWGCTVGVCPAADGATAQMVRVLDWRTPGLGRYVMAARVAGRSGPFVTLTWPGYTGVLQAVAPGRFAAAMNQAPMPKSGGGLYPLDWLANKARVWRSPHPTPAHLLRKVMEQAPDYANARRMLADAPVCAPAIFTLAGMAAEETCAIERTELKSTVFDGRAAAANHWATPGWKGRARGHDSAGRVSQMLGATVPLEPDLSWLEPPVLNPLTRLVMIADAARHRLIAQGFERAGPATRILDLAL